MRMTMRALEVHIERCLDQPRVRSWRCSALSDRACTAVASMTLSSVDVNGCLSMDVRGCPWMWQVLYCSRDRQQSQWRTRTRILRVRRHAADVCACRSYHRPSPIVHWTTQTATTPTTATPTTTTSIMSSSPSTQELTTGTRIVYNVGANETIGTIKR